MINLHVSLDPPRAETHLHGQRLWACATEPHEQLAHVLQHLARQLVAVGVPRGTRAAIWRPGQRQRGPVRLWRLLAGVGGAR
jgi:hypothetical protein